MPLFVCVCHEHTSLQLIVKRRCSKDRSLLRHQCRGVGRFMIFEDVASIKVWARIVSNLQYAKTRIGGMHVPSPLIPSYYQSMMKAWRDAPSQSERHDILIILYPVLVAFSVDEPEFSIPMSYTKSWNCPGGSFFRSTTAAFCPGDLDGLSQRLGHIRWEIHPHRGCGWYRWMVEEIRLALTSWNGKWSRIIYRVFIMFHTCQVVGNGISEPSTVWSNHCQIIGYNNIDIEMLGWYLKRVKGVFKTWSLCFLFLKPLTMYFHFHID